MRTSLFSTLLLCFLFTGCLSTVRIKRDPLPKADATNDPKKNTSVQGIPFYVKTARCKQQTTWIEPIYTLTLKRTIKFKFVDPEAAKREAEKSKQPEKLKLEPKSMPVSQILSLSQYRETKAVQELQALLSKATPVSPAALDDVEEKWKVIAALPTDIPLSRDENQLVAEAKDVITISNTSTPEALVDYSRVYYYNAPRPWVGSSQVDLKLAADATMTEGSTQVQNQTLSTILSALPINAVLTGAAKAGGLALTAELAQMVQGDPFTTTIDTVEYQLTVQQEAYKHTHTAYSKDFSLPCVVASKGVTTDYALTIEASGGGEKKEDDNTVKVNGTVVLPKQSTSADKK